VIREAICRISERKDLSREEAAGIMEEIVSGEAKPALISAFLAALRTKGETVDEITGFATVMRKNAIRITPDRDNLLDTCGTGGDGLSTFNISTTTSFVIAGAGVGIAKHGNRAVSSSCGSADLLEAAGVEIGLDKNDVAKCIDEVGIGFLFAQKLHPAMKHAAGPRKELGMKTVFNLLGPLTNPASVKKQLVGIFDAGLAPKLIRVLEELGAYRAMVVHSDDGLDEVSISATTTGHFFDGERHIKIRINPEDYGLKLAPIESITAGDVEDSKRIFLSVLEGAEGPAKDVVIINAGVGLFVSGVVASIREGIELARESVDTGRAGESFDRLKNLSHELGAGKSNNRVA
jgi:anthranilate phosphoribosyltransferase